VSDLIHPENPPPPPQRFGTDTAVKFAGPTVPAPPSPPTTDPPPGTVWCPVPGCGQAVPYRDGYKGLIAECPTHGSTLVTMGGRPLPRSAALPARQPGEPPPPRDGRPLPPAATGQYRAGDVIGHHVVCQCGVGGCEGTARVDASQARGHQQNFIVLVCGGGKRVRAGTDPVTLVDPPATEPNPEQPYLRSLKPAYPVPQQ
jgi:hypothetical protein